MIISEGIFSHCVLQRNLENKCDAVFSGECQFSGILKTYITLNEKAVDGFFPFEIGDVQKGMFKGCIRGLETGGTYFIRITIEDSYDNILESNDLEDVLVGDVWILAGQSNMEGNGYIKDALTPVPMVRAYYLNDLWEIAEEPLHFMGEAIDEIHIDLCGGVRPERGSHTGTGPGISFAQEIYRVTGVPQGLIPCAHGGTSLNQWDPELVLMSGNSLYGAMIRRFLKNGGKVAGVLWYQGCNEVYPDLIPSYTSKMTRLISSMRKDFKDGNLPIVAVQLSRVCFPISSGSDWNAIQEQQRLLPQTINDLFVVPSIDLALDDWIHISGYDHKRLGHRMANAMSVLKQFSLDAKPPIELKDIAVEKDKLSGSTNIILTYNNVIGKLESMGRPSGFELAEMRNELQTYSIYRVDLDNDKVILKTTINYIDDAGSQFLYYGYGVQPYCNITDSADRSLPVMGPVRVGKAKAYSVVTTAMISKTFLSKDRLKGLEYPHKSEELGFQLKDFNYMFLGIRDVIKALTQDVCIYYLVKIECDEKMNLNIYLGYDGPVKIWLDKKEVLYDSEGTGPAWVNDSITPIEVGKGQHEIVVALDSDNGRVSGIFLRFERTDVPQDLLEMGPGNYEMPKFLY